MAAKVVIVGGGVGGTIVANQLARKVNGKAEITLISQDDQHMYQPGLLFIPFNLMQPDNLYRSQRELLHPHVVFAHDKVVAIDPEKKTVKGEKGQWTYDFLVIATGSRLAPEAVPGLSEGGHWFYDLDHALKLREALRSFEGGKVVIATGVPHKCPVAPLEVTFILHEWLEQRGLREKTEITYLYPIGRLHSLEPVANWAAPQFEERGIQSEVLFNMEKVDPEEKVIYSLEGSSHPFDLLITIPPHKGQKVLIDSGISDQNGWVSVDRHTLQWKEDERVWALGDTTDLPISKAGSTAHYEADVVAENIAARIQGGESGHFYNGKVFCFIETGLDTATYASFNYKNPPRPPAPSPTIHWFKVAYNQLYWQTVQGLL
ncbi:MAG: NAD(P)/FAD-dependent oxidoreductase [Clostridiales bacterium]|nr:NAD(P)/FAD-dependent oxidoreductase [Clostridiales bacterium]